MKLRYQQAVIGFRPDLTDPNAKSIPIATLLVGEVGADRLGASVVLLPSDLKLDVISRAVLADVPQLLRRHVDEAFSAMSPTAPLDHILHSTHDALRNSLHVSVIDPPKTAELTATEPAGLSAQLLKIVMGRMEKAAGIKFLTQEPRKVKGKTQPRQHSIVPPPSAIWPLSRQTPGVVATA